MARIKVIDKAIVDEKLWYTIFCDVEVLSWLRDLNNEDKCYHIVGGTPTGTLVDIREDVYMFALIKWSK